MLEYKDRVYDSYLGGYLWFYVVRTIINLAKRERDIYHTKYLIPGRQVSDIRDDFYACFLDESDEIKNPENNLDIKKWAVHCEESDPIEIRRIKEDDEIDSIDKLESFRECETTRFYWMIAKCLDMGMTQREIARESGVPRTSVSRAVKKLRALLNEGNTTGSLRSLDMGSQAKSA